MITADFFDVSVDTIHRWRDTYKLDRKINLPDNLPNKLTEIQLELVIGSQLGDGCLSKINGLFDNSNYTETHCARQYEYLKYKTDILGDFFCSLKPKQTDSPIHIGNEIFRGTNKLDGYYMTSFHSPVFTELERKWYKIDENGNYIFKQIGKNGRLDRIKIIPNDLTKLTSFIVAIWFFDDGYTHWNQKQKVKGAEFCCECFTTEENERLVEMLKKLGITNCHYNSNKRHIYIRSASFVDFLDMLRPHLTFQCKDIEKKLNFDPTLKLMSTNTSGHTGIYWHNGNKKWHAQCKINGKTNHLGNFDNKEDAFKAREDFIKSR